MKVQKFKTHDHDDGVNKGYSSPKLYVRDIMTANPLRLMPSDSLKKFEETLNTFDIRHIPIVDKFGNLVGLASHRDFLTVAISRLASLTKAEMNELYSGICVEDIMSRNVSVIGPDEPLKVAAQKMLDLKYGCLPVVEDRRLVGIITESDFLKAVL